MDDGKGYPVGYGKPPPQHRFKKGQSGNPRGRPSAKRNEAEIIAMVRDELMTVTINGKTKKVTAFEAAVRKALMTALSRGSVGDIEKIFKLFARYGAEPEDLRNAQMKEAADKVTDTLLEIFRKTHQDRQRRSELAEEGEVEGQEPPPTAQLPAPEL